jgi:hypothetical protein
MSTVSSDFFCRFHTLSGPGQISLTETKEKLHSETVTLQRNPMARPSKQPNNTQHKALYRNNLRCFYRILTLMNIRRKIGPIFP